MHCSRFHNANNRIFWRTPIADNARVDILCHWSYLADSLAVHEDKTVVFRPNARKVGVEKDYNSESYKCISRALK